jgi:hypothetical protein
LAVTLVFSKENGKKLFFGCRRWQGAATIFRGGAILQTDHMELVAHKTGTFNSLLKLAKRQDLEAIDFLQSAVP